MIGCASLYVILPEYVLANLEGSTKGCEEMACTVRPKSQNTGVSYAAWVSVLQQ